MKKWVSYLISLSLISALIVLVGCGDEKKGSQGAVTPNSPQVLGQFSLANHVWEGKLSITNPSLYRTYLEEFANLCNPFQFQFNFSSGFNSDCGLFDASAADISLQLQSTTLPTQGFGVLVSYRQGTSFNNGFALIGGAGQSAFQESVLQGQFVAINGNSGFELRQGGRFNTPSFNAILRLVVAGQPTDSQLTLVFLYRDVDVTGNQDREIGRANLIRRQ